MSDIAWIYDGLGQYEEGLKYIKKAVKLGRDDAWLNEEYGACLAGLDRYEEAIEKYKYALNLDDEEKDEAYIYRQLGWCYRQLEDYEKALEYALIAYELDRDDIRSLSQVGWFYDYMEKYEDGLPFLLRAEELGRDDEWINTEIATNLGRSGKTSEGIERFHKSLAMVSEEDINQRIFINSEIAWLYDGIGKYENAVYPQIEEALKALRKTGAYVGIATAKPEEQAKDIIKHFKLDPYFEVIRGANREIGLVHKLDILKEALKDMETITAQKYKISRWYMVGDRKYDMEAAKALNCVAMGVSYGYGSVEELESAGADYICESPSDVLVNIAVDTLL